MIPILYKSDETDFGHHGLGDLADCISAHVTEQRNGKFELEFVYPVTGRWFDQIQEDCLVKTKPNDVAADQLFRIYQSTKPMDGKVTFNAKHISYDLAYNPLPKTKLSGSAAAVLNQILNGALNAHPFNGFSDSTTESSSEAGPCTVREALGGKEGSLLDNWGGEYEFDNFTIRHHVRRGRDTGVLVEYGKNLTDFNQERALADVFTSVYAYAKKQDDEGNEQLITLDDKIIHLDSEGSYPIKRTLMLDLSDDDTVSDGSTLKAATEKYAQNNKIDQPSVSWSIKFQNLRKTQDYKNIAVLETCSLCDYITVRFRRYGVDTKAEIIEVDYNVLLEEYNSMDLGDPVSNFVVDYQNQQKNTQTQFNRNTNFFLDAIDRATKAITGASGGYVRLIPSRNPQEIVIMDTPDIATATRVWRWNLGGLGYSHNGYNGPYELAMTMDGEIVADFITAGVLRGILIEGTDIHMFSADKTFDARLNSSGLVFKKKGQVVFSVDEEGNVNTYGAGIHGGEITGSTIVMESANLTITLDPNGFHLEVPTQNFKVDIDANGLRVTKTGTEIMSIAPNGKAIFRGEVFVKGTETVGTNQVESGVRVHPFGVEYYKSDDMLASLGRLYTAYTDGRPTEYGVGYSLQKGDYIGINYLDEATGKFPYLIQFLRGWMNFNEKLARNTEIGFIRPTWQKRIMRGSLGLPNSELFPGSSHAPQGLAYANVGGVEKVYFRVRVSGDAWTTGELNRILEYNLREDGTLGSPVAISNPIAIGHQNISAWVDPTDNQVYLYTGLYTGRGFSKVRWRGASTSSSDVSTYELWQDGQIYDQYIEGSPCVSKDGRYIVIQAKGTWVGSTRRVQVFDRAWIEANQGSHMPPLVEFDFETTPDDNSQVLQDLCCDGNIILLLAGYYSPLGKKIVYAFDMAGHRLSEFHVDGPLGEYSDYQLFGWDTGVGTPMQIEPEGIDVRENGNILVLFHDVWKWSDAPVVSYDGNNYAYIREDAASGNAPYDELSWTRVDRAATAGEYSGTTTYQPWGNVNKKDKAIYELSTGFTSMTNVWALNRGVVHKRSPASVHVKAGTVDVSFPRGDDFTVASYNQNSNAGQNAGANACRTAIKYFNEHAISVYDTRGGADLARYCYMSKNSLSGKDQMELRAGATLTDGGGINITTIRDVDTTNNAHVILYSRGGSTQYNARLQETGAWRPGADNTQNLGTGSNRWKNIYAANGSINTSDRNMKYDIANLPDEVLDAWSEVDYKQFRFKAALAEQGEEGARLHIGVIAQDIKEAFERHGLDAMDYGLICFDSWPEKPEIRDENGVAIEPYRPEGAQWGVRPNECVFLESALMRRELNLLKAAVNGGQQ